MNPPALAFWTAAFPPHPADRGQCPRATGPAARGRPAALLLLFAVVAGGLLFGVVGMILAAPLTVVLYVLVKRLYVQEALDTPTPIPGEND